MSDQGKPTFRETVHMLAGSHVRVDGSLTKIWLSPDPTMQEIRLVEVSLAVPESGDVLPFRFAPCEEVPFPVSMILLSPKEYAAVNRGELHLPEGWKLEELELIYLRSVRYIRLDCGHSIPSFPGWQTGQEIDCPSCMAQREKAPEDHRKKRTYREAVSLLAEEHRAADAGIVKIFLWPDPSEREIRIVEVSSTADPAVGVQQFRFSPNYEVPFPTSMIALHPEDWAAVEQFSLRLPWKLEELELIYERPMVTEFKKRSVVSPGHPLLFTSLGGIAAPLAEYERDAMFPYSMKLDCGHVLTGPQVPSGWRSGQEIDCPYCERSTKQTTSPVDEHEAVGIGGGLLRDGLPDDGVFRPWSSAARMDPIPMRINCPECSEIHIDEGEFATKPHHTHACQHCGNVWRPAIVDTVGVRFLPGFKNS